MNIFRQLLYRSKGVFLYGNVQIDGISLIHPSTVIGVELPPEDAQYCKPNSKTIINKGCHIGPFVTIYRGAILEQDVVVEPYARIGGDSHIGANTRIIYGARIHDRVLIGSNCIIAGNCSDDVRIGDGAKHFGRLAHAFNRPTSCWSDTAETPPIIEAGAVVGANALIVGPITIGANSYVAAGEVVRKSIPPSHIFYKGQLVAGRQWNGRLRKSDFFTNENS